MGSGILAGAAAGAAGTAALDAVTYLDMAIRGRPASDTPERTVEKLAGRAVPGDGQTRDNRLTGLGSLSGIATGAGVGAAFGLLRRLGLRPPTLTGGALVGLAAMAATNSSMASMGISDPRTWSAADWLADLLPHLAYGLVTYATLQALEP